MRKPLLFTICIIILNVISGFAQVQIDAANNVGIGINANSSYKVSIQDNVIIHSMQLEETAYGDYEDNSFDMIIDHSYLHLSNQYADVFQPVLFPTVHNSSALGKSNKIWADIYGSEIHYYTLSSLSDARIKENINDIGNGALAKIIQLQAKRYDIKREYYFDESVPEKMKEYLDSRRQNKVGFIAQELAQVFPELVNENKETGLQSIQYVDLIPYLVEAIKEQQLQIEQLEIEINQLKSNREKVPAE